MSRESCIQHPPYNRLAIVREDYFIMTGGDAAAAALLNYFEYRANAALAKEPEPENISSVYIGPISTADFQSALLGISTDKQIRNRLNQLKESGMITCPISGAGKVPTYTVEIARIQQAINRGAKLPGFVETANLAKQQWSNNRGQKTKHSKARSSDQGQTTKENWSNDQEEAEKPWSDDQISLYKNFSLERSLESSPLTPQEEPDPGVCVEESPTAHGTEPEQTEPLATHPVKPEVIGTTQDSGRDKFSAAAPKANPGRDKVWSGQFKHPAAAMEVRFAAGANAPSRSDVAVLKAERMNVLVALGNEAWELVRIVDGRVDFTELARAGARSLSPDGVPEARVLRHLVRQSREGTRTDWQILLDAGREAMAKKAEAEQVAAERARLMERVAVRTDGEVVPPPPGLLEQIRKNLKGEVSHA